MKMIRNGFVVLFMLLSCKLFAKQISFQVVQKDNSTTSVTEKSLSVEDELLNGFFDKGFIVTNSQAVNSESEDQDIEFWNTGFGDAFNGFSDYFVQVMIYFSEPRIDKKGKTVKDIKMVSYKVTSVKSGENIEEASIDYENQIEDSRKVSSDLVNKINRVIKAKA